MRVEGKENKPYEGIIMLVTYAYLQKALFIYASLTTWYIFQRDILMVSRHIVFFFVLYKSILYQV